MIEEGIKEQIELEKEYELKAKDDSIDSEINS